MTTTDTGPQFVPPMTDFHPVVLPELESVDAPPAGSPPALPTSRVGRLWRGRPADAAWVRPGLLSLLDATGVL